MEGCTPSIVEFCLSRTAAIDFDFLEPHATSSVVTNSSSSLKSSRRVPVRASIMKKPGRTAPALRSISLLLDPKTEKKVRTLMKVREKRAAGFSQIYMIRIISMKLFARAVQHLQKIIHCCVSLWIADLILLKARGSAVLRSKSVPGTIREKSVAETGMFDGGSAARLLTPVREHEQSGSSVLQLSSEYSTVSKASGKHACSRKQSTKEVSSFFHKRTRLKMQEI